MKSVAIRFVNCRSGQTQSGFTLIELVMVIILIGIMSYGATSLFASRDAYAGFIAKDQLISSALLAQQVALGMSATANPVSLSVGVSADGSNWEFELTKVGESAMTLTQETTGADLVIDGVTLADGAEQVFTWDSDANLTSASNHEIRFVGTHTSRVCLSAAGYAFESKSACPW